MIAEFDQKGRPEEEVQTERKLPRVYLFGDLPEGYEEDPNDVGGVAD